MRFREAQGTLSLGAIQAIRAQQMKCDRLVSWQIK